MGTVLHVADGTLDDDYLWGHGLIGRIDGSGAETYAHGDGLGSIRSISDTTGVEVGTTAYDAFGATRSTSGVSYAFGFTGEQVDAETGFVYLRARYMDPGTGRFLTKDPLPGHIVDPSSLHRYGYVANSPLTFSDPSGLKKRGGGVSLGKDWSALVHWVTGTDDYEIHVYYKGDEVGIVNQNGWITKHGHAAMPPAQLTDDIANRLNGLNIDAMRRSNRLGPKGTANIKGLRSKIVGCFAILDLGLGLWSDYDRYRRAQENGVSYEEQLEQDIIDSGNPDYIWTLFGPFPNPYQDVPLEGERIPG